MSILDMTALELGKRTQSGNITAVQAAEAPLARIKAVEPSIHAYATVNEEKTMEQAGKVQAETEAGRLSEPLAGVPVAIKDNMRTEGTWITCSLRMLENFIPAHTVQTAVNLEQVEAIILGKISMDELAVGSTTETSALGATRSPWSPEHVPGGSSGGSCAAVVAGEYFYALGSDTGGSIRQSSSFRGVTGIKPTYGTVSRYGLIAHGSSLDQIGPVARDVPDYVVALEALASHDPKGSTSVEQSDCDFTAALSEDVKGIRIGIPESYPGQGLDQEVKDAVLGAARVPGEKGAIVETFGLKLAEYAIPAYYVIASTEASSNSPYFDDVKYGYRMPEYEGLHSMYKRSRFQGLGPEVKRHIMLGLFVLSSGYYDAYYLRALRTKTPIRREFDRTFTPCDIILTLVAPATVPWLNQSLGDPLETYLGDIHTISVNLAGLPGISPPCGLDSKGLPIGLQLIGDCLKEKSIVRAAYTYEKAQEWKLLPAVAGTPEESSGVTAGETERRMSHG